MASLTLGQIVAEFGDQIRSNGDNARTTFAMRDLQDTAVEIDIGHA